ncbi:MAG: YbaB/EbfC family nucleoid-associated protein [Planctomycetes bacterium]|nr:YbaB/EbfC family nucleoid-associated protein [Planctomycetota bacterium]
MATGFGDMSSLLKQAQEMQRRLQETQKLLDERVIEGTAGGGAVRVQVNGNMQLVGVKIEPAAVDPSDVGALEDMVAGAMRQALSQAKTLRDAEMGKVTGGMNLPGLGF